MNPTLVPTLSELRIELDRLNAVRKAASVIVDANPDDDALYDAYDKALEACWHVLDQIAAIPDASLADLRIKAYAFNWSANLVDGESYTNPSDGEELIMRALVAGLLDERIA